MSFQGFQGSVGSVGSSPTSSSAQAHLTATQKRIAELKAAQARKRAEAAAKNLTSTGLVLDTNKPVIGGQSNIPNSKFQIIGGKAVPRGAAAPNIARSVPSIKTRDGRRLTASSPNLTPAQKQALGIITAQQQATFNLAQKISAERRAQQLSGKSVKEAQAIATGSDSSKFIATEGKFPNGFAFTKKDQNTLNTALQTDIIRSNAAKLGFAEQIIRAQQLDPEGFGKLDDLQAQLNAAPNQDAPIQNINVSTDEFGNVVSPRNVKLQIENAGLTGGLTSPQLNILTSGGAAPNVEEVAQVIESSLADITDNAQVGNLTTITTSPDGIIDISFSEEAAPFFRQQFGDTVFDALGRYFDLRDQGVDDFFDNPEGLRVKIGEEEVQLGGTGGSGGFAGDLLDNQGGFDILGLITNPIVLIAVAAIAGLVIFTKVRK